MTNLVFFKPHLSISYFRKNGVTASIESPHPLPPVTFVILGRKFAHEGKPRAIVVTQAKDLILAKLFKLFFGVPYLEWATLEIPECPPLRFQGPAVDLRARLKIPREKKLVAWLGERPYEIPGTALVPVPKTVDERWMLLDNADLAVCETPAQLYQAIAAGLPVIVPEALRKTVELHDLGVVIPELTRETVAGAVKKLDLTEDRRRRALELHARYFNFEAQFPKALARFEKFPDL